jgi:Beta/Gamma crystallin
MKFLAAAAVLALLPTALASAQEAPKPKTEKGTMRLFKGQSFTGEAYLVDSARSSLMLEMNVGSIAVYPGEKWEVCDKPRFKGSCNVVDADMANMGTVAIQSARPVKQ